MTTWCACAISNRAPPSCDCAAGGRWTPAGPEVPGRPGAAPRALAGLPMLRIQHQRPWPQPRFRTCLPPASHKPPAAGTSLVYSTRLAVLSSREPSASVWALGVTTKPWPSTMSKYSCPASSQAASQTAGSFEFKESSSSCHPQVLAGRR